jgi:hypothetical protein
MHAKKLFRIELVALLMVAVAIVHPVCASQEYVTLETKYFIVKAPSEKMKVVKPELMDKIYETFLSLLGVAPEGKILVIYEEKHTTSFADGKLKIIHIWKGEWEKENWFYSTLCHELGHIFTLSIKNNYIISPALYEFARGITEGWAIFLGHEVDRIVGPFWMDYQKYQIEYTSVKTELEEYEKEGDIELLKKDPDPWMGILFTLVEKYGWHSLKRFFQFVTNLEIPLEVDSFSAFVWAMGIATNDPEGVYWLFVKRWHIPVKHGFFLLNVSVRGPLEYSLKVDKEKLTLNKSEVSLLLPDNTPHRISVYPPLVTLSERERLICKNYSVTIRGSGKISFDYERQYYLKVDGWRESEGWYEEGSQVKIRVPLLLDFNNGTRGLFRGFFEGEKLIAKENSTIIKMDSPKIIRISWEKEYRFEIKSEYGVVEGSGWYKRGDEVTVSLSETLIDYGNSTRRRFVGWYENEKLIEEKPTFSIVVDGPKTITTKWEIEYEVKIISDRGVKESNWYKKGEKATLTVPATQIQEGLFTWVFVGWQDESGNIVSTPQYSIVVEKPTTIKEVWRKDLNAFVIIMLLLISVAILGAIASRKILHRK